MLLEKQGLVIAFDQEHAAFADRLREPKTIDLLRQIAEKDSDGPVNIRIEVAGDDPAEPVQAPKPTVSRPAPAPRDELLQQARSDPGVKKLLREFGAQVVDIRPLESRTPETPTDAEDSS